MQEAPLDQRLDRGTIVQLYGIAESVFSRHGINFSAARRASGWSNATWMAGGMVLRLSVQRGNENIQREARLAALLPKEVGYPPVMDIGSTDGYDWCLSKQIPGRNLGEIWLDLDWDERINALRELWGMLEAVHSVDVEAASQLTGRGSRFYPTRMAQTRVSLDGLLERKLLTARQVDRLTAALDRFLETRKTAAFVLNHGDFTIENALWHEGKVVALLDFEYAVIAPDELDLNELLKMAFVPNEMYASARLRQLALELAGPMVSHPGSKELLLGYAILLDIWMLEENLLHPPDDVGSSPENLNQVLVALSDGSGGYLAPVYRLVDSTR